MDLFLYPLVRIIFDIGLGEGTYENGRSMERFRSSADKGREAWQILNLHKRSENI